MPFPRANHRSRSPEVVASLTTDNSLALPDFLSVKQAAEYLQVNDKKVYELAAERRIPATKITGKWLIPRDMLKQWLHESSHGGVLSDRLTISGGDDPLLQRAVARCSARIKASALIDHSSTYTKLGLSLLALGRADACCIHWGPASESTHRHPGLIRTFSCHHDWVIVRIATRETGILLNPRQQLQQAKLRDLNNPKLRWLGRPEGAGTRRSMLDALANSSIKIQDLPITKTALTAREAAAELAIDNADVVPGCRAHANEHRLDFLSLNDEALDFVLPKAIYFRSLFQELLNEFRSPHFVDTATQLGGYDLSELGNLIWSA